MILLKEQMSLEAAEQNSISSELRIEEIKNNITDLERDYEDQQYKQKSTISNTKKQLIHSLTKWENEFVLKAPVAGQVSFFSFWNENQFITTGNEFCFIVQANPTSINGKVIMPVNNSVKVEEGQKVTVKLDDYAYKEYGMLVGKITSISLMPRNQFYSAEVEFPNHLETTYKKSIKLKAQMSGEASIITKEQSVLDKVFFQFKNVMKNN